MIIFFNFPNSVTKTTRAHVRWPYCVSKTDGANESRLIRWTRSKETQTKRAAAAQRKRPPLRSQRVADWSAPRNVFGGGFTFFSFFVSPVFVVVVGVCLCEGIWHCRPLTVWTVRGEIPCYVALCIDTHMDTHRNIHNAFRIFTFRPCPPPFIIILFPFLLNRL